MGDYVVGAGDAASEIDWPASRCPRVVDSDESAVSDSDFEATPPTIGGWVILCE